MFKDYNKYLSTSLKVYLFVLSLLFILKLMGLDYFVITQDSKGILMIEHTLSTHWYIKDIIYFIPLWITQYFISSVVLKDNSKRLIIYNVILIPFYYFFEAYKLILFGNLYFIAEFLYFFLVITLYAKRIDKIIIIRYIKTMLYILILQFITMYVRYYISFECITDVIANIILNLDYIIILLFTHKIVFMKGVDEKCYQAVQFSSSLKKTNLKNLLLKLQKNLHNFRNQDKVTKLAVIIYSILSFIWNVFTLIVILFVAKINGTFIECIFIANCFWITKHTFGKAFHLPNMLQCFVVSNITYYVLNRITTPLGISILVPIMLGVGLSYVTSKLVKKLYKPLYKGMPKDLFEETILKIVDKNSTKYKICYEYFVEKKSAIYLSMKYNYSEAGIRKIKDRINKEIKKLN